MYIRHSFKGKELRSPILSIGAVIQDSRFRGSHSTNALFMNAAVIPFQP